MQTNSDVEDINKKDEPIFRLEKYDEHDNKLPEDQLIVKEDKRSITSKYNALKTGKRAILPLLCNNCDLRPKEAGGIGGCIVYVKDSTCNVRADIRKYNEQFDTRNPEDMKQIVDDQVHLLLERVAFAEFRAGVEGGLLDKATLAQLNTLRDYVKLQNELMGSVKLTAIEEQTIDVKDDIKKLFRSFTAEKIGGGVDGKTN